MRIGRGRAPWAGRSRLPHPPLESPEVLPSGPTITEPAGDLTLREALSLALLQNPEIKAFAFEVRAREAAVLQAGLLPNPHLGVVVENFGNNALKDFDSTTITLQLSQLIELGGKRAARTEATQLARDLAGWDYERERIKVLTETQRAYVEVLSAQGRTALSKQVVALAEEVAAAAAKRVTAGKVSPVEETKARVATDLGADRARRVQSVSSRPPVRAWRRPGAALPRASSAPWACSRPSSPFPPWNSSWSGSARTRSLARWATRARGASGRHRLRRDPGHSGPHRQLGVRHFEEPGDDALVAGISIPCRSSTATRATSWRPSDGSPRPRRNAAPRKCRHHGLARRLSDDSPAPMPRSRP